MSNTIVELNAEIKRLREELAEARKIAEEKQTIAEVAVEELQSYKVMEQEFHRMLNGLSKKKDAQILEFKRND